MFSHGCAAQSSRAPRDVYVSPYRMITPDEIKKIKNPPVKPEISATRLAQIRKNFADYRAAAYTDGIECKPDDDGVCQNRVTIYMYQWTDANGTFCMGLVPKFILIGGTPSAKPKRIIWELKPLDPTVPVVPAGSNFEFLGDGDHGILVFRNIGTGGNEQLKNGKRGSGPAGGGPPNMDPDKFHMMNMHTKIGTAAYLPIIVHKVPVGGDFEYGICGTPDPLIYNVN